MPMDLSPKTILLVEDEALLAVETMLVLQGAGYQTLHETSGEKAVALVRSGRHSLDLVLMDIDLGPGMDGTEAAQLVLAEQEIPVLFVSGHTEPEIVERAERITSFGYVDKHSGPQVLLTSIRTALRLHAAQVASKRSEELLRVSEGRFRQVAASAGEWIWEVDPEGTYRYSWRPAAFPSRTRTTSSWVIGAPIGT